jgi:hypothetical protein
MKPVLKKTLLILAVYAVVIPFILFTDAEILMMLLMVAACVQPIMGIVCCFSHNKEWVQTGQSLLLSFGLLLLIGFSVCTAMITL